MDYKARFYDPSSGCFLQPDSITPDNNPQNLNKYTYVGNNPINKTDPSGHCGVDTIGIGPMGIPNCIDATINAFKAWNAGNHDLMALAVDFSGVKKVARDMGNAIDQVNADMDLLKSSNGTVGDRALAVGRVALFGLTVASAIVGTAQIGAELMAGEAAVGAVVSDIELAATEGISTTEAEAGSIEQALATCPNSFEASTVVSTVDGEKAISTLKVGDRVLAYNQATRKTGYYAITKVWINHDPVLTEVLLDGEHIETTPHHPFYTQEKGWVDAGELKLGMHVRKADGSYGLVWWTWNVERAQVMYNLTVDTAHTYFVGQGQWLVHNCGGSSVADIVGNSEIQPNQPYLSRAKVERYAESMKDGTFDWNNMGLNIEGEPDLIEIYEASNGKFIWSGNHRFVAARLAGIEIPESAMNIIQLEDEFIPEVQSWEEVLWQ